jgi:transcriptional regulator with XRE-family HTH domain
MTTLSEKIEACYKAIGKDRTHFAQEIGISEATIRNWKTKNSMPAADVLLKIAKYFNLPMEYFFDDAENPLSDKEIATIIKLRKLNEEQIKMIDYMIEKCLAENEK